MQKLRLDSKENHFVTDCDIYHFYRPRHFFSLWVLRETSRVVRAPILQKQYLDQPIDQIVTDMKSKGYKHEVM